MRTLTDTQFSILELVPVRDDKTIQFSLQHALELAQTAERLGYSRMWLAEHHNMDGIASSATAVLLGYLLANTNSIKLGSGGIMLPNHAPLVVAEQFGTLATLYPDRIELGLGRAPGTDQMTMRALRRGRQETEDQFPQDVLEILQYFKDPIPGQRIVATPGQSTHVPVWLLGSSLFSAQLAAKLGLPYSLPLTLLRVCLVKRFNYIGTISNRLNIWIVLMFLWAYQLVWQIQMKKLNIWQQVLTSVSLL